MHERSNGLGGGFAAYGIYPEYRDFYAFHVFFEDDTTAGRVRRSCGSGLRSCRPSLSRYTRSRRSQTCR